MTKRRLIVCYDGTWQTPDNSVKPTNVVKLLRAIPSSDGNISQIVFYDRGVGTGNVLDQIRGGAFGHGLLENVVDGYRFLANNYQPGDEVSSQEMALALSTQLFDDRLTITTNLGVSHQNAGDNSNSLIGDVDVEYKLNEEGNTRVHAFNRSNEYDITQQEATYTQGVGVFYQESFSNLSELMCKLKNLFIRKDKECANCNEACSEFLTEEEKVTCKKEKREAMVRCREERKK